MRITEEIIGQSKTIMVNMLGGIQENKMERLSSEIQKLYKNIEEIEQQLSPNDAKANSLRKLYERLIKVVTGVELEKRLPNLSDEIDRYISREKKFELHSVCRKLCRDLNTWSHDNQKKPTTEELQNYATRLKNIIQAMSGIAPKEKEDNRGKFSIKTLKLNDRQQEAVLSDKQVTLITAGPGTGKTHLIVGRILQELNKNPTNKIAGLSFTNVASDELRNKITSHLFSTNLAIYRSNIITGTIHFFALFLVQEYFKLLKRPFDYIIVDDAEEKEILVLCGNNAAIARQYHIDNKILTFDGIIETFNVTMKKKNDFRSFIKKQIHEIVIDEAQDLDKAQYEMLDLLFKNNSKLKLFFVADPRQNIYGFRGGSLSVMETFGGKNLKATDLIHSYRCPQNILDFANQFTFKDCKNPRLTNAEGKQGTPLNVQAFPNKKEEANWIAQSITQAKNNGSKLINTAIIYSTTFYFKEILTALNEYSLSFRVFGGQYFINPDILLFKAILNLIFTNNKYALEQTLYACGYRGVKANNIEHAFRLAEKKKNKKAKYCLLFARKNQKEENTPLEILENFIKYIKKENIALKNKSESNTSPLDIYSDLKEIITNDLTLNKYEKLRMSFSPRHPQLKRFYSRTDEIIQCSNLNETDYITVTTVHASKGLEWDNIYIPGLYQGGLPRWFKDSETERKETPHELKKFYVACTRAKEQLHLTRPVSIRVQSKKNGNWYTFDKPKSIFIKGISNEGNLLNINQDNKKGNSNPNNAVLWNPITLKKVKRLAEEHKLNIVVLKQLIDEHRKTGNLRHFKATDFISKEDIPKIKEMLFIAVDIKILSDKLAGKLRPIEYYNRILNEVFGPHSEKSESNIELRKNQKSKKKDPSGNSSVCTENTPLDLLKARRRGKIIPKKPDHSTKKKNWMQCLWEWADNNAILDMTWIDGEKAHWHGIPRNELYLLRRTTLWIDEYELKDLPLEIGNLTHLKKLNLEYNQLVELPSTIINLTNLEELYLRGNPDLILNTIQKKWINSLKKNGCKIVF